MPRGYREAGAWPLASVCQRPYCRRVTSSCSSLEPGAAKLLSTDAYSTSALVTDTRTSVACSPRVRSMATYTPNVSAGRITFGAAIRYPLKTQHDRVISFAV